MSEPEGPGWEYLPSVLLEKIFALLEIRHRYWASQVCRQWYWAFYAPQVWANFVFEDGMLCRRKFMLYSGWQKHLNPYRVQLMLQRVGHLFRAITIKPTFSFYNLHEFVGVLTAFIDLHKPYYHPLQLLRCFRFNFACQHDLGYNRASIIGTGGQIYRGLLDLLERLRNLEELQLTHLLLDSHEAVFLLDNTLQNCADSLRILTVVDCSKLPMSFLHVGLFFKLEKLVLSPQHLDSDVVELLSFTHVKTIILFQDEFTCHCSPVPWNAWKELKKNAPHIRVELYLKGQTKIDILLQEKAPVRSILYHTKYSYIRAEVLMDIVENYSQTLEIYGHHLLPRIHRPKAFHDRADTVLVLMAQKCHLLHTLIIRERISTSTLLLIVSTAKNLSRLCVRKNAVVLKCEWPHSPYWSADYYEWLRTVSHSYSLVENEISKILRKKWQFLSDKEFKTLNFMSINL